MPIDPSIILSLRPPAPIQSPDPLENYAKIMGVQNAMQQGQLGKLQLEQTQRTVDDERAVQDAYKQSGGDTTRFRQILGTLGQYKPVQALDKFDLEKRKTEAEIGKTTSDTGVNQQKIIGDLVQRGRDALATVNSPQGAVAWYQAQFADKTMGPILQGQGISLDQRIAEIPTDPIKFQEWKNNHILGADKLVAHLDELSKQKETNRSNLATEANGRTSAGAAASQAGTAAARLRYDQLNPPQTYDADRGININTRTNAASPVLQGGAPIGPKDKDLNEGQGKATGYGRRALIADDTLRALEKGGVTSGGRIQQSAEAIPIAGAVLGPAMNAAPGIAGGASKEQQRYQQAKREFIAAALRVESGATIGPNEYADADKRYFPQFGDDAATIAQKQAARQAEIESFKIQAGSRGAPAIKLPNAGKIGGVLTPNADGSFNYGAQ